MMGDRCMKCSCLLPDVTGRKFCDDCRPGARAARLEKALAEKNAALTRLGDLIQEREREVHEAKARAAAAERECAEWRAVADGLAASNRDLRAELQRQFENATAAEAA